jgi:hypothetical protein
MQLIVIAGPDKGRSFDLTPGETLLIGRSQGTQTRLVDQRVSRVHCEVQVEGDRCLLIDSNGAGGSFVNGKRVNQQELRAGDVIQVGETQLRFSAPLGSEASTLGPADLPHGQAAADQAGPLAALTGQTLAPYEVGPALAKGQSSIIFRATDTKDGKTVALKVLRPEFSKNDEDMQRFVRAMKTMLPLRHPNLVALYGAGKAGPHCWVAMEYVDGESLTQVIQRIGVAGMLDWRNTQRTGLATLRAGHRSGNCCSSGKRWPAPSGPGCLALTERSWLSAARKGLCTC